MLTVWRCLPQGGFSELQGSDGVQKFCIIRVQWGEERLPQVHY